MGTVISLVIGLCLLAVVILVARWVLGLMGVVIPQPLLAALGILLFVVLLVWLFGGGTSFALPRIR